MNRSFTSYPPFQIANDRERCLHRAVEELCKRGKALVIDFSERLFDDVVNTRFHAEFVGCVHLLIGALHNVKL